MGGITRRRAMAALAVGLTTATGFGQETPARPAATPPAETQPTRTGSVTHESLGAMLRAIGVAPKTVESRHDFRFTTSLDGEEWNLKMTATLSHDGESLWLMAWLDELPKDAADVPRTALLKMLAANDRLGDGTFFAFVPGGRRFVLQRVVPNHDLTTQTLAEQLRALGETVRAEYPVWSTAAWKTADQPTAPATGQTAPTRQSGPARSGSTGQAGPPAAIRHAGSDGKFSTPVIR